MSVLSEHMNYLAGSPTVTFTGRNYSQFVSKHLTSSRLHKWVKPSAFVLLNVN